MSYSVIGFGNSGRVLAKAFSRKGIEVSVATTRDPESFAADAAAIGPKVIAKTLAEAVRADIIFLAVRFESHPDVAKTLPSWQGKTIVDVTNAYGVSPEELGGQPSSQAIAQAFSGARLVKGFNHLLAATLGQDPAVQGGRRVVFASGKVKATNKPFEDDWIFAITVRAGRLTSIQEYIDTQAWARAAQRDASGPV